MTITNEDLELIRKFQAIRDKGYYCDGKQVTDLHNKVLGTRLNPTNCGSCIRQRINALVAAADKFERMIENKAQIPPSESIPEVKVATDKMAKVRAARKLKKDNVSEES